jgi:MFS family permease
MPEKISTPAGRVTAPGRCASPPLSPTVEGMTTENAPSGTIRSALRYPGFRWLLSGLAVSQTGDWLYNLALVVLVYQRTHSALWVGVTTAVRVVPVVVLGLLGGVLADRFDRRRIMITCDLARMGLMVLLAAVAAFQLPIVLAPVIAAAASAATASPVRRWPPRWPSRARRRCCSRWSAGRPRPSSWPG